MAAETARDQGLGAVDDVLELGPHCGGKKETVTIWTLILSMPSAQGNVVVTIPPGTWLGHRTVMSSCS
jgi:hypothetical protein